MDGLVNFWKNSTSAIKAAVILLLLLPIVVLTATLVVFLRPEDMGDKRLVISNYWETTDAPKEYLYNLQNVILNAIGQKLGDTETVFEDAVVREGSYSETEFNGVAKVKMIVDVPSIRQSFAVEFSYNRNANKYDDPDVRVSCPYYTDIIYTDSKCIAASVLTQIERYLPRYDYVRSVKYGLSLKKDNDGSYLAVEVPACGDEEILGMAEDFARRWIRSVYLDPEDYRLEVVDVCR